MAPHGVAGIMARLDTADMLAVKRIVSGCRVRFLAVPFALSPALKDVSMRLLTLFALLMLAVPTEAGCRRGGRHIRSQGGCQPAFSYPAIPDNCGACQQRPILHADTHPVQSLGSCTSGACR